MTKQLEQLKCLLVGENWEDALTEAKLPYMVFNLTLPPKDKRQIEDALNPICHILTEDIKGVMEKENKKGKQ